MYEIFRFSEYQYNSSFELVLVAMPEKKRSREEFEAYLRAMLKQDYPKIKFNSPDAWRQRITNHTRKNK